MRNQNRQSHHSTVTCTQRDTKGRDRTMRHWPGLNGDRIERGNAVYNSTCHVPRAGNKLTNSEELGCQPPRKGVVPFLLIVDQLLLLLYKGSVVISLGSCLLTVVSVEQTRNPEEKNPAFTAALYCNIMMRHTTRLKRSSSVALIADRPLHNAIVI